MYLYLRSFSWRTKFLKALKFLMNKWNESSISDTRITKSGSHIATWDKNLLPSLNTFDCFSFMIDQAFSSENLSRYISCIHNLLGIVLNNECLAQIASKLQESSFGTGKLSDLKFPIAARFASEHLHSVLIVNLSNFMQQLQEFRFSDLRGIISVCNIYCTNRNNTSAMSIAANRSKS